VPFDAIKMGDLATGEEVRGFAARLIVRVPFVDDLGARLPLLIYEEERPGPDNVLELLAVGNGRYNTFGKNEGRGARPGKCLQHQAVRLLHLERKDPIVDRLDFVDELAELLTIAADPHPTPQGGDDVGGTDGLAVTKLQAFAQCESIAHPAFVDLVAIDHLRLRLEFGVHPVERVSDQIAMPHRDPSIAEDGIKDLEIGVDNHSQCIVLRSISRRGRHGRQHGRRSSNHDFPSVENPVQLHLPGVQL
jgi:hypothetical protein